MGTNSPSPRGAHGRGWWELGGDGGGGLLRGPQRAVLTLVCHRFSSSADLAPFLPCGGSPGARHNVNRRLGHHRRGNDRARADAQSGYAETTLVRGWQALQPTPPSTGPLSANSFIYFILRKLCSLEFNPSPTFRISPRSWCEGQSCAGPPSASRTSRWPRHSCTEVSWCSALHCRERGLAAAGAAAPLLTGRRCHAGQVR